MVKPRARTAQQVESFVIGGPSQSSSVTSSFVVTVGGKPQVTSPAHVSTDSWHLNVRRYVEASEQALAEDETRRGEKQLLHCSAAFFTTSSACCCISFSSSLVRVRTLSSCCLGRELGAVFERPGVISMPSVACRALSCAVGEDRATLTANANAARPSSSTMNPPSPFMPSGCHHHPCESKKISDPASPPGTRAGRHPGEGTDAN